MRLIMVRHGETIWNAEKKIQGHSDVPLSETGKEQVLAAASYLVKEELEAIYTSDLSRAIDTALAIGAHRDITPVIDQRLRESHMGIWEGLDFNTIYTKYRKEYDAWYGNEEGFIPEGEGVKEVEKRVLDFIKEIAPKHQNNVAIATHGGVIKSVLACALGSRYLWEQAIDNASITILKVEGLRIEPEAINIVPWRQGNIKVMLVD